MNFFVYTGSVLMKKVNNSQPLDCRTLFKGIKSDLRNDSDGKIAKREADGG